MRFQLFINKLTPLFHTLVCAALCFFASACGNVNPQTTTNYVLPLADRPEQLLQRKAYTVSYNSDTRQPNWVAWSLTAEHCDGTVKRPQNAWHDDKDVPEPRAYFYDYKKISIRGIRYDHGHLCPAGDNKWDSEAMYESFLMTNCSPQSHSLNSGVWNQIEQSCRQWAKKYGEIIIVCGPIFYDQEHDTIGDHRIPVPEAFFKVVVCLNTLHPKGIAFICSNIDSQQDHCTITEVEQITGLFFFPDLDSRITEAVKNNRDIGQW